MPKLSFRGTLRNYIPPWFTDRPQKTVAFRLLYGVTALLDAGAEAAVQGLQARYPGLGTPTALPDIGRDRRIFQGPEEAVKAYAARLRDWLNQWRYAGHAYALAKALQAYLAPGYPKIRIVTRSGVWFTLPAGGGDIEIHRADPNNFDWDSVTHPQNATNWSDFWVIVYDPSYATDGDWGDPGKWESGKTFGNDTTSANAEAIRALIQQWKGAHTNCVCLIYTYDPTSYNPFAPPGDPSLPDGRWGYWSKDDANGGRIKSRRSDARYWEV